MPPLDLPAFEIDPVDAFRYQFGDLDYTRLVLREALPDELGAVNALIGRAVNSWDLPQRVKRISLPIYHYRVADLQAMRVVVAEDPDGNIVGVAAWELASTGDAPRGHSALLLHGIYVDPDLHRCGIGTRLLGAAVQAAANDYHDGLIVRAQSDAIPFFEAQGLERLAVRNSDRDYPHRFWYPVRRS